MRICESTNATYESKECGGAAWSFKIFKPSILRLDFANGEKACRGEMFFLGRILYMLYVDLQASERAKDVCTYMYLARRMMTFEALRAWQIRERENESLNS